MEHRWPQHVKWTAAAVGGLVGLAVLFWFSPGEYGFYPRCLFHSVTGLACPGCGSLRSVHYLLHGQVVIAFRLNPLIYVLAPAILIWRKQIHKPGWLWTFVGAIVAFTIARNL